MPTVPLQPTDQFDAMNRVVGQQGSLVGEIVGGIGCPQDPREKVEFLVRRGRTGDGADNPFRPAGGLGDLAEGGRGELERPVP